MNCLVTGGAGFIGSHLVERLLLLGHRVRVVDNFSTGREQNLAHIEGRNALEIHKVDIADHEALCALFEGMDWVFHLAALADIVPSIERPVEYMRVNVEGTASVVEAARKPFSLPPKKARNRFSRKKFALSRMRSPTPSSFLQRRATTK